MRALHQAGDRLQQIGWPSDAFHEQHIHALRGALWQVRHSRQHDQRNLAALKNGLHGHGELFAAFVALVHAGTVLNAIKARDVFRGDAAMRADGLATFDAVHFWCSSLITLPHPRRRETNNYAVGSLLIVSVCAFQRVPFPRSRRVRPDALSFARGY